MRLTARRLNRTLLERQHLLTRTESTPQAMASHLVGLQAQESMPVYLSLAARIADFDPYAVTAGLEDRSLVRLLTMRGTIHLLAAADAVPLRAWTQARMERELKGSQNTKAALGVDRATFDAVVIDVLAHGPLAQRAFAAALAEHFPDVPAAALGQLARCTAPLVQLPPRGCWKQPGGVTYEFVHRWLGVPAATGPLDTAQVEEVVRRYLRAFGPATAADVTAWSAITRLGPVVAAMDDLVRHEDEAGKVLVDVPEGELAEEDVPAPVRLLGCYDNLWLSHAGRDRVTPTGTRDRWMGANGGRAHTLFADGTMTGLWQVEDGRVTVLELLRPLTRAEQSELDDEITRVEDLLAR